MPDLVVDNGSDPSWAQAITAPQHPEMLCVHYTPPYAHLSDYYTWYDGSLYSILINEHDPEDFTFSQCIRDPKGAPTYVVTPQDPAVIFPVVMMELVL